jgi:Na+/H+ antiporter NhaD/arsenite permease-like protein
MKRILKNLFYNGIRIRKYFLANSILLGVISIFLYSQESQAYKSSAIALACNLCLYLFLNAQHKKYVLRKGP